MASWDSLPSEIKYLILTYVFANESICWLPKSDRSRQDQRQATSKAPSILSISKSFANHKETIRAIVSHATVTLQQAGHLEHIHTKFSPSYLGCLKSIRLSESFSNRPIWPPPTLETIKTRLPRLAMFDIESRCQTAYPDLPVARHSMLCPFPSDNPDATVLRDSRLLPTPAGSSGGTPELDLEHEHKEGFLLQNQSERLTAAEFAHTYVVSDIQPDPAPWYCSLLADARKQGVEVKLSMAFSLYYNGRATGEGGIYEVVSNARFSTKDMKLRFEYNNIHVAIPQVFPDWFVQRFADQDVKALTQEGVLYVAEEFVERLSRTGVFN